MIIFFNRIVQNENRKGTFCTFMNMLISEDSGPKVTNNNIQLGQVSSFA